MQYPPVLQRPLLLTALASALLLGLQPAAALAAAKANDAEACAALASNHGGNSISERLQIQAAELIRPEQNWQPDTESSYEPVPVHQPFCRVAATFEGNIGIELWLPQQAHWNGRLLGTGVGGDAGKFNFTDMGQRLNEGFVTFSTDSGHKQSQARWMADPKARQDYTHRAVHQATLVSKRLLQQFYGRAQKHSYFLGCSGGGRQGMKEMQTYPGDFDGIISGAPAPYMALQSVRMMWSALEQKHQPEAALSGDDWALYEREVTAHCDANDGVQDGIIENLAACDFDTATLQCGPQQTGECLTAAKRAMLDTIVKPMPNEQGEAMDFGLFPSVRTRPGPPSPLLRAMWADGVYNDPNWDEDTFHNTRDLARANQAMPELRADSTYIDTFISQNRKAIIYQGWSDPSTVAGLAIDYYRDLARVYGGVEKLNNNVRLLLVPGMYHCRRGPGADQFGGSRHQTWPGNRERDILWAMIAWVEKGKAPNHLVATKLEDGEPAFTRKLCPFPQSARYDGKRDSSKASAYACASDPVLEALLHEQ